MDVVHEIVMVPIAEIKPYARNARKNEATIKKLVELLPKVGFNVPLVLDRNNVIVKGHTRWAAGRRLSMTELPCVYTDADPETIKLDRLADNRVQEFSLWDADLLGSELAGLNLPFKLDLGILEFKLDLPALNLPGAGPASASAGSSSSPEGESPPAGLPGESGEGEPGEGSRETRDEPDEPEVGPGLSAADLVDTSAPEYLEVLCNKCGNRLYVKP
jgi:ParB family chromosome partitioning protein